MDEIKGRSLFDWAVLALVGAATFCLFVQKEPYLGFGTLLAGLAFVYGRSLAIKIRDWFDVQIGAGPGGQQFDTQAAVDRALAKAAEAAASKARHDTAERSATGVLSEEQYEGLMQVLSETFNAGFDVGMREGQTLQMSVAVAKLPQEIRQLLAQLLRRAKSEADVQVEAPNVRSAMENAKSLWVLGYCGYVARFEYDRGQGVTRVALTEEAWQFRERLLEVIGWVDESRAGEA